MWKHQLQDPSKVGKSEADRMKILEAFHKHMVENCGVVSFFPMHSYPTMQRLCKDHTDFKVAYEAIIREANSNLMNFAVKKMKNSNEIVDIHAYNAVTRNRTGFRPDEIEDIVDDTKQITININGIDIEAVKLGKEKVKKMTQEQAKKLR